MEFPPQFNPPKNASLAHYWFSPQETLFLGIFNTFFPREGPLKRRVPLDGTPKMAHEEAPLSLNP